MSLDHIPVDRKPTMSPRVVGWTAPQPGGDIPQPLIQDDRAAFPPAVVNGVLAWLESTRETFEHVAPTPITIVLHKLSTIAYRPTPYVPGDQPIMASDQQVEASIGYGVGLGENFSGSTFRHCTVELLLRESKDAKMLWGFHYLAARDQHNRCIVGPFLRMEAKAV